MFRFISQKGKFKYRTPTVLDMQRRITRERAPTASNVGSRERCVVVSSRTMGGTPTSPFCSQNQVFSPHRKSATLGQEDLPL